MRGTPGDEQAVFHADRLIPAHAGNTAQLAAAGYFPPAHPRACGEHFSVSGGAASSGGSSPRTRGTQRCQGEGDPHGRLIPAHAGNTTGSASGRRDRTAHPRACGEHSSPCISASSCAGSSPRMRGTLDGGASLACFPRLIPAHAGNTCSSPARWSSRPAHPRACGEHSTNQGDNPMRPGSSPRMRGTLADKLPTTRKQRLIPAHAGNTASVSGRSPCSSAHPRACGEHSSSPPAIRAPIGSSPRMRGTQQPGPREQHLHRLIPAHAGNTAAPSTPAEARWAHPRACGEHGVVVIAATAAAGSSPRMRGTPPAPARAGPPARLIPAHAGNTVSAHVRSRFPAAHPRACGEHDR